MIHDVISGREYDKHLHVEYTKSVLLVSRICVTVDNKIIHFGNQKMLLNI